MNIRAKVMEKATEIKTRYGRCLITKVRILQNGEDIAIFSKLGDPIATSKTIGQHLLITTNANGKYQIVDNSESSIQEDSHYTF